MPSRRQYLAGAAAIAGLASIGFAASQEDMLAGEPSDVTGSTAQLGEFAFNTAGIDSVSWLAKDVEEDVELAVVFEDTLPSMVRLHRPDSKKVWQVDSPSTTSETRLFHLPIGNRGTWELVSQYDGSYTSLQIPINPGFQLDTFGLDGDRVVATITNPTDSPSWIKDITMSAKNRFSERWRYLERLMPGETFRFDEPFPFDHYEDIRIYVDSGTESGGLLSKKDFV